jgi:hypothetical protein
MDRLGKSARLALVNAVIAGAYRGQKIILPNKASGLLQFRRAETLSQGNIRERPKIDHDFQFGRRKRQTVDVRSIQVE